MKYLKVWEGAVSGSLGGRDDGYPETKTQVINNIEELISSYDGDATYFKLREIPLKDIKSIVSIYNDLLES